MAGGAMGQGGGAGGGGNTTQSLSQLNTILNQLGGGAGTAVGPGQSGILPALTNMGSNLMKPGMQPPSAPPQGAPRPVMGGGMGPGVPVPQGAAPQMGQGMPIGLMNMALAQQNGLYPGFR